MTHHMFAVYEQPGEASLAADRLVAIGIPRTSLNLVATESYGAKHLGVAPGTKGAEGAATGATVGGILGGVIAALAATGTVVATGGAILVAGPIAAALAGAGAGGAAGGVLGGLVGLGISDNHIKAYKDTLENDGGVVLGVEVTGETKEKVKQIFKETGGKSISSD